VLGPHESAAKRITIDSTVFTHLTRVPNTQTALHATGAVHGRIYALSAGDVVQRICTYSRRETNDAVHTMHRQVE